MKYHADVLQSSQSHEDEYLLQVFTREQRSLHKALYAERAKEVVLRAKQADKRQIFMALKGSTKKMVQAGHDPDFIPLPFALNDLDDPEKLICDPEGVKETTCQYFMKLYDHSRVCKLPKPWLMTPSVTKVNNVLSVINSSGLVNPPCQTSAP